MMSCMRITGLAIACTIFLCGCEKTSPEVSGCNSDVVRLRHCLDNYFIGSGHEPIDTKENKAEIFRLLKRLEPLDSSEKINLVLDIALRYDATDNHASSYADEMLIRYGKITEPFVQERIAINPDDLSARVLFKKIKK